MHRGRWLSSAEPKGASSSNTAQSSRLFARTANLKGERSVSRSISAMLAILIVVVVGRGISCRFGV
jgi:hypothetical protein